MPGGSAPWRGDSHVPTVLVWQPTPPFSTSQHLREASRNLPEATLMRRGRQDLNPGLKSEPSQGT